MERKEGETQNDEWCSPPSYRRPCNLFDLSVSAAPKCGDAADAAADAAAADAAAAVDVEVVVDVEEVCLLSKSVACWKSFSIRIASGFFFFLVARISSASSGIYIMKCILYYKELRILRMLCIYK